MDSYFSQSYCFSAILANSHSFNNVDQKLQNLHTLQTPVSSRVWLHHALMLPPHVFEHSVSVLLFHCCKFFLTLFCNYSLHCFRITCMTIQVWSSAKHYLVELKQIDCTEKEERFFITKSIQNSKKSKKKKHEPKIKK